jgi:hypothetical protein
MLLRVHYIYQQQFEISCKIKPKKNAFTTLLHLSILQLQINIRTPGYPFPKRLNHREAGIDWNCQGTQRYGHPDKTWKMKVKEEATEVGKT